ncbi:50S ribosomal protein L4P [Methanocaldococcus villosus KIN24-T80]|uniref:Large ribosomal subunit protein uL4 n=1 Tax=Methanocaldococcus villosus KIN24-T80 TaxID=1069083 RepID=N6VXI3_9EURY|nr:50S ribosomal protein L4 [Methanocaldococcus villosus]ENN95842.1 50S ribosomal protein L4P [Methanocaldococcus villosus KIN24-T80]
MEANVYNLNGEVIKKIELPEIFETEYRPDLIKRAFLSAFTAKLQPKGTDPLAGKRRSAESWGKGYGLARVPRLPGGRAALAPMAVGGRRAHPPKVEKILWERINKKERIKAIKSAIAATANIDLVRERGHRFSIEELPIVVENEFENIKKTKEVFEIFKKLKIDEDVIRAKEGKKIRAGKGKMRGRRYKKPKSVLVVVGDRCDAILACRNLAGVDVITAKDLSILHLAPGGKAGRLTLWTENAIEKLKERF